VPGRPLFVTSVGTSSDFDTQRTQGGQCGRGNFGIAASDNKIRAERGNAFRHSEANAAAAVTGKPTKEASPCSVGGAE
jgi:hypothetical protein